MCYNGDMESIHSTESIANENDKWIGRHESRVIAICDSEFECIQQMQTMRVNRIFIATCRNSEPGLGWGVYL